MLKNYLTKQVSQDYERQLWDDPVNFWEEVC